MLDIDCVDTICALSTPQGRGGISVIRLSGKEAKTIASKNCPKWTKQPEDHKAYFCHFVDSNHLAVDEVVLTYFAEGKSFTGEETVEIACHGSPIICNEILKELVDSGARPAKPGEFSFRAFIHQRLDLVQVESVLAMIESQSKSSAKLAFRQLKGALSDTILQLEDKITLLLANFEASIDFSTEDIEIIDYSKAIKTLDGIISVVKNLIESYKSGRVIHNGIHVSLVGAPNVGKSSLLNSLLHEDKAIVSDIPGTTRDIVEGEIQLNGISLKLFDTAGIRNTEDRIEKIGIEKSHRTLESSDLVLFLIDPTESVNMEFLSQLKRLKEQDFRFVITKSDLLAEQQLEEFCRSLEKSLFSYLKIENLQENADSVALSISSFIPTSVEAEGGTDLLKNALEELTKAFNLEESAMLSQARHFDSLKAVYNGLEKTKELVNSKASAEFVSFELHECIYKIHEILGKNFDDEVMDRVFKEFCIGK